MHDRPFQDANQVFFGKIRKPRQDGLDRTKHKDAVRAGDMAELYEGGTLAIDNPVALQRKVYLEVSLHFCRRGREGLRELWKDSFVVKTDENGREYVTLGYNELEKNHQGLEKNDIGEEPRMYGQAGDLCPVSSFKLYISKLHSECPAFFQRANMNYKNSGQWYYNMPIGKNTLSSMMKNMSQAAGLSRLYTNHCLRVTAISVLRARGVDSEDIRTVFRHRSTDGLKPYCQGPTDGRRYDMSKHLHEHGRPSTAVVPVSQASATAPQPSTSMGGITGLSHGDRNTDMEAESAVVPVVSSPKSDCLDNGALTQVATSTAISNRNDTMVQRALFAGARFEANCAPVFNFHGNFHFN